MKKILFLLLVLLLVLCGCEGDTISAPEVPEEVVLVNPIIDLVSNPQATFQIFRPDLSKSDDPLGREIYSGTTPAYGLELAPGSYVVRFLAEGHDSKLLGLRLAYGDTNVSKTVDLQRTPVDPPEYEAVTGHLSFSDNPITLGETVGVTPTMYNGAIGILSMGGETHFVYSGAYVFPFKPLTAGEHIVSFLAIGEGGDYLPINEFLTVLPGDPEAVTLNAWIVGDDTVPADTEARFGWSASANADSVTSVGYYTDGNIGLSEADASIVILQDHVLTLHVWKGGEIKDSKSLYFYTRPPVVGPDPMPTLYASAYEVYSSEPNIREYQVVEGQEILLSWNVKFYNPDTDEVRIDGTRDVGDLGPRGIISVTVSSDTTFVVIDDRGGQEFMSKIAHITVVPGPIEQPEFFRIGWDVDVWVGQRAQDPHEADLMSGIYLPANLQVDVSARLAYSPASAGQDDEDCRIGFLSDSGEHWAYLNGSDDPTFPDQGEDIDQMFHVGIVSDFSDQEGRMVIQSVGGEGKCVNPNSVHCSRVELEIQLP